MSNNFNFTAFQTPGTVRHGLPGVAYVDEGFYAAENARLFSGAWVFVGFAHEISAVGSVMPVTVGGLPVVLVRGEDDSIRAFHNVCRHRCLRLVARAGNVGRLLRCPYHSWSYDLSGALRAAPYFGGADNSPPKDFDMAKISLETVRCAVWHDWIFVNLDGDAPPFENFIAPLAERLARWDLTKLTPATVIDFGVINTNWKFLLENFIEPYHVQFVHATTTDQPLVNHAPFIDRHCLGCTVELPAASANANTDTLAVDSNYLTLFPNFVLATYAPDQLGVHLNTPHAAGKTHQRRAIYLLRDDAIAEDECAQLAALWRKVHAEDHAICAAMQLGRRSPVADDGGWLSPAWENAVRRFQELVYDKVLRE